jgi:hypothetical protein
VPLPVLPEPVVQALTARGLPLPEPPPLVVLVE